MRRRLRYLRRARELGFRDLGGLVFDLRRFERDRPDLVEAKIHALFEVDHELRALERALDDRREIHELREPGIASCPRCGALHGSEARFCPSCGLSRCTGRSPSPRSAKACRPRSPLPHGASSRAGRSPPTTRPARSPSRRVPARRMTSRRRSTTRRPRRDGDPATQVLPPKDAAGSDDEQAESPRSNDG